jgi:uncharacterized membrane protein
MGLMRLLGRCGELEIETILGNLLRAGVLLAAAVVSVGLGLYLHAHASAPAEFGVFKGEPPELRTVAGICRDAASLSAPGIMQFGLLLLMATPVARVALSMLAFACQKDKIYVVVTLVVLSVLAYSMAGGSL